MNDPPPPPVTANPRRAGRWLRCARQCAHGAAFWLKRAAGSKTPFIAGLVLNESCNLRCEGCRVARADRSEDAGREEVAEALRSFRRSGIRNLAVTGGEPFHWRSDGWRVRDVVAEARRLGFDAMRDSDGFEAFDMEYDYDIREVFDRLLRGECPLSHWEEGEYPANYNKLRCLENHDQPRIASFVTDMEALVNWTAMLYFLKGTTLIYAGQEWADTHTPSLFEKETVDRETGKSLMPLMKKLAAMKKRLFTGDDHFLGKADDAHHIAVFLRQNSARRCVGVFSLRAENAWVEVPLPDGEYLDHLSGTSVRVKDGKLRCTGTPMVLDKVR